MKTIEEVVDNIKTRLSESEKQMKTYDCNETYLNQLEAVSAELNDLLKWITRW